MSVKKIAVILSGCGVFDGAEIHESVMSLYALELHGCTYQVFAPDMKQYHVVNHISGDEMNETRNVMVEAARIARGNIKSLDSYQVGDFDALLLPGGFGAAKNLSTFAFEGVNCTINTEVASAIRSTHEADKPIGALCIAPVILAKVIGNQVQLTIGQDEGTSDAINQLGGRAVKTQAREITIDEANKVVTNPCYMLDSNVIDITEGAKNVVGAMLSLM